MKAPLLGAAFAIVIASAALPHGPAWSDPTTDDEAAARLDPDYAAGKQAIDAKDWRTAIARLSGAALRDTGRSQVMSAADGSSATAIDGNSAGRCIVGSDRSAGGAVAVTDITRPGTTMTLTRPRYRVSVITRGLEGNESATAGVA